MRAWGPHITLSIGASGPYTLYPTDIGPPALYPILIICFANNRIYIRNRGLWPLFLSNVLSGPGAQIILLVTGLRPVTYIYLWGPLLGAGPHKFVCFIRKGRSPFLSKDMGPLAPYPLRCRGLRPLHRVE